jgi:hypothetical protein
MAEIAIRMGVHDLIGLKARKIEVRKWLYLSG